MTEDLRIRLGGLLSLAAGLPLGWYFILRPLQQARAGAAEVTMHINAAFVLVPMLLIFGAAFVVGGENARYRDVTKPGGRGRLLLVGPITVRRPGIPLLTDTRSFPGRAWSRHLLPVVPGRITKSRLPYTRKGGSRTSTAEAVYLVTPGSSSNAARASTSAT
jgi:hypothetical protein